MKMSFITRLTERGQVSMPVEVRSGLGLVAGNRVTWQYDSETGAVSVVPVRERPLGGARMALGFATRFRACRASSQEWLDRFEKPWGEGQPS